MQKPNLIRVLILILTLCICLFGCSAKGTGTIEADTSANGNTISAVTSTDEEKSSSDGGAVKAEGSSTANKNKKGTSSNSKTTTAAKQTTKQGTKASKTTKHTAKQTTKRTTTTSSTVNCTVTVECKKVLDHMDNLKAGHEAFVPSGGIFFSRYPVTLKNGSTVYDAVKIACGDNGVTINATNSQYGAYIAGFNNIDEKDCGNESGWLYSVNGNTPGKSCGKYIVSNGDNIVFSYTCSYK